MSTVTVRALAAATPASRNRVVDLLRAVAILVVALGHWTIAGVVVRGDGLHTDGVLNTASWSHPLTWVFQVMPVFFVVGGYANALSWRSARARHLPYAAWLRSRLRRLITPVLPLLLTWLVLAGAMHAAGVPTATLRTASQVALVPTWFLAAYVLVVAVAPGALMLWERWGWWTVSAPLALGGLLDWASIHWHNEFVAFPNYLIVWGAVHQLGFAWRDGRLDGPWRRLAMAAVGLAGLLLLVGPGPYPVSMIGIDGQWLNNSSPARVTMGFLGLMQGGLVLLAEKPLARWLGHPRAWTAVVAVNARIMTLYLWHLTAMILVIGASVLLGGVGLRVGPLTGTWWATRPIWYAVLAAVTFGFIVLLGRIENPSRDERPAPPLWQPVLATGLVCGGLGTMAALGIVGRDGVHWLWPLVPVAGMLLLGVVPLRSARRVAHAGG